MHSAVFFNPFVSSSGLRNCVEGCQLCDVTVFVPLACQILMVTLKFY